MKTSDVPFEQLRQLLVDLDFTAVRKDQGWRFEHSGSDTVFLFRPYQADERVNAADLTTVRTHLEWRGLLNPETFADLLKKAAVVQGTPQ
jgi:hypothetical protein